MSATLPLAGKRIVVTRSRHQAGRLAEALEEQGAAVVRLPTIEVLPPESYAYMDAMLDDIASFQWLIVTSANGAVALADRMQFLRLGVERLQHLAVAAIGPATAQAVSRIGLTVSVTPEEYVGEAVVSALKDKVQGKRVLLARAAIGRDVIPQQLRKCGADIHVVETYRTVIPRDSIELVRELLAEGQPLPDAVTFTSSSTVDNFMALLALAHISPVHGLHAISIGPITTETLRKHHWEPAAQALQADIPALVEACCRLLAPDNWVHLPG